MAPAFLGGGVNARIEDDDDAFTDNVKARHGHPSPLRKVKYRPGGPEMRSRALWTKVRVAVILNQLLMRIRRGERFDKLKDEDKLLVDFVEVNGLDVREEIRRVQAKFSVPTRKNRLLNLTIREKIYLTLTEPSSSRLAMGINALMFVLIFVSISSFIASTMPQHAGKAALDVVEMVCQLIFTIEYVLKIGCAPNKWKAIKDPLNFIDFVSIVPWYMEICISGLTFGYSGNQSSSTSSARVLRIFRLFRVVKIFRLGSRARKIQVIILAVQDSADMFLILGFLLLLGLVMFSALIYFAENGQAKGLAPNEIDDFDSIPRAFWWCMVTLMTVGYGDAVPTTIWGKLVAALTMLGSVVITALPISVIGANFTQQWLAFKSKEQRKMIKLNIKANSKNLIREMHAYAHIVTTLSEHISAMENEIVSEVNALRSTLLGIVRMSETMSCEEVKAVCLTVDVRFSKLEDLREELEDLVETYELVSATEFSVSLQQLKAVGNKMSKLHNTGALLDADVGNLVSSTANLRAQLFELKEIVQSQDVGANLGGDELSMALQAAEYEVMNEEREASLHEVEESAAAAETE